MSLPTIPAILSAILFAGSAGAAATTFKPDRTEEGRSARAGKPDGKHAKARGVCAIVDCTPQQKAELKEIREDLRDDRKADRGKGKALDAELATEFRKDNPSDAKLQEVFSKKEEMRAARAKAQLESLGKIHDVLTPQQRDALADRIEARGMAAATGGHGGGHDEKGKAKDKAKDKGKAKAKAKAKTKRDGERKPAKR